QVAAKERDVVPALELAPHGAVQRRIEIGQLQRATRVVDLCRVVQQALRDRRTHQRVENTPLQAEHLLVDRQVERRRRAAELLRVLDVERRDRHLAQEGRRKPETVGGQYLAGQQVERGTLLGGVDRRERLAPASDVIAQRRQPADVLRRVERALAGLVQAAGEIAPQDRVAFTGREIEMLGA